MIPFVVEASSATVDIIHLGLPTTQERQEQSMMDVLLFLAYPTCRVLLFWSCAGTINGWAPFSG
jgi:hypothetical protein